MGVSLQSLLSCQRRDVSLALLLPVLRTHIHRAFCCPLQSIAEQEEGTRNYGTILTQCLPSWVSTSIASRKSKAYRSETPALGLYLEIPAGLSR